MYELLEVKDSRPFPQKDMASLSRMGPMLFTEPDDVKFMCGLIMQSLMKRPRISWKSFWSESSSTNVEHAEIPRRLNSGWIHEFQDCLSRLSDLENITERYTSALEVFRPHD